MRNFSTVVKSNNLFTFYDVNQEYHVIPDAELREHIVDQLSIAFGNEDSLDVQCMFVRIWILMQVAEKPLDEVTVYNLNTVLTPSEFDVVYDLAKFFFEFITHQSNSRKPWGDSRTFVYVNLNTGSTLACSFVSME